MYLVMNSVNPYPALVNLGNYDVMEIYSAGELDYRIAVRRFSVTENQNFVSAESIRDLSLTIARYETLEEAETAFWEICEYIDEGHKAMYHMPKDTVEQSDVQDDDSGDVIKNALINLQDKINE